MDDRNNNMHSNGDFHKNKMGHNDGDGTSVSNHCNFHKNKVGHDDGDGTSVSNHCNFDKNKVGHDDGDGTSVSNHCLYNFYNCKSTSGALVDFLLTNGSTFTPLRYRRPIYP
jgi:hypothetical protein